MAPLARIPRALLHVALDDLPRLGVADQARSALRGLMADLPLVPDASLSAQLVGPPDRTLPCLAVLARHVGQGLRDHNLSLAHDRGRLHLDRRKLLFMDAETLAASVDERPASEAVLFVVNYTEAVLPLVVTRDFAGLATFITTPSPLAQLAHWRALRL